jgi:hypothetical protein
MKYNEVCSHVARMRAIRITRREAENLQDWNYFFDLDVPE